MDMNLVFSKTPAGEEAVRETTRVVQRNLRMVLVQVDGKLSVGDLVAKMGNPSLVVSALKELEREGLIERLLEPRLSQAILGAPAVAMPAPNFSRFSEIPGEHSQMSRLDVHSSMFSSFGKPIMPVVDLLPPVPEVREPEAADDHAAPAVRGRVRKIALLLLAVLVATSVGLVIFFDTLFHERIEHSLQSALGQPVRLDKVGLSLLPVPQLWLEKVELGTRQPLLLAQAKVGSPLALLLNGGEALRQLRIEGGELAVDGWFAQASAMRMFPALEKIELARVDFRAGDFLLPGMSGDMNFVHGALQNVRFSTVDRTLLLELKPAAQGMYLNVEAFGWRPDPQAGFIFTSLQSKGLLQTGRLVLNELDAALLGGVLKGNLMLDWRDGISWAGDADVQRLNAQQLMALLAPAFRLEGEMSGLLRARAKGSAAKAVLDSLEASFAVEMGRGAFHGMDLGEAVRRGAVQGVHAGSTRFDQLRADLQVTPARVQLRQVHLTAGMLNARGDMAFSGLRAEGNFLIEMKTSVARRKMPLSVSGSLPALEVQAGAARP